MPGRLLSGPPPPPRRVLTVALKIREYADVDAHAWLRCRLLSFFTTQYYDDVVVERPRYDAPAIELVAVVGPSLVGLLDIEITDRTATIEVIAVHPDYTGRGIGTALLEHAIPDLMTGGIKTLDAWTREDAAANAWYLARGFVENYRYLHIHKEWDEHDSGFESPPGLSRPIRALVHAQIEREAQVRDRFRRVYVCRQYLRQLP